MMYNYYNIDRKAVKSIFQKISINYLTQLEWDTLLGQTAMIAAK